MLRRLKGFATLATALGVIAGLVAAPAAAQGAKPPIKVTLVQAHANVAIGEEVFMYAVPQKLGYFKEEGLEVELQGANGGTASAQVLVSGTAQFATTQPEIAMTVREQGGNVVAFFNVKKRGGYAIAVLPNSPLKTLADLKGKQIGVASLGSGAVPIVKQSLADAGLKDGDYTLVASGTGAPAATALRTGNVDALGLWDSAYGVIENAGVKMRYIEMPIQDKLAGFSMITTDKFMSENPKAVEGMCRAVAKGLVYTLANLPAAVRIFHQAYPQTVPNNVTPEQAVGNDVNVMNMWLANATKGPASKISYNYPEMWKFSQDYYLKQGMLKKQLPLDQLYTNRFVDACNNFDPKPIQDAAKAAK